MTPTVLRPGVTVLHKGRSVTLESRNACRPDEWLGNWRDNLGRERWASVPSREVEALATPDGFRTIFDALKA